MNRLCKVRNGKDGVKLAQAPYFYFGPFKIVKIIKFSWIFQLLKKWLIGSIYWKRKLLLRVVLKNILQPVMDKSFYYMRKKSVLSDYLPCWVCSPDHICSKWAINELKITSNLYSSRNSSSQNVHRCCAE